MGNVSLLVSAVGNKSFLLMGVVLMVVWVLITAMFGWYLYKFKKAEAKAKILGTPSIVVASIFTTLLLIFAILEIVFYTLWSKDSFTVDEDSQHGIIMVVMTILGFISLLALVIHMFFFLPTFGIAFDQNQILFMGESIPYMRIQAAIMDEKKHAVYIFYTQGKRSVKRQKFSDTSVFGLFVIKNFELTGKQIQNGDADEYFKSSVTPNN